MKKIILILFLLIELLINEFTLAQLAYDKQLGIDAIIKIRFFNFIVLLTWIIIFFYYSDLVKVKPCGHFLHKECFNEMNGQLKHIRDTSDTGKLTEIASEGKCATCSQRFNSVSTMYSLRK